MEFFETFLQTVAKLPDLVSLILCPALLLVAGILLAIFRQKSAYLSATVALGGAYGFLLFAEGFAREQFAAAFGALALYCALAAIVSLLFLFPFAKKREEKDAGDELYEKFYEPLDIPADEAETEEAPSDDECGIRLDHAVSLIERLKGCSLSPGDRLEIDNLSRVLDGYRGRELKEDELRSLNDCLATVLKLTAKYKL